MLLFDRDIIFWPWPFCLKVTSFIWPRHHNLTVTLLFDRDIIIWPWHNLTVILLLLFDRDIFSLDRDLITCLRHQHPTVTLLLDCDISWSWHYSFDRDIFLTVTLLFLTAKTTQYICAQCRLAMNPSGELARVLMVAMWPIVAFLRRTHVVWIIQQFSEALIMFAARHLFNGYNKAPGFFISYGAFQKYTSLTQVKVLVIDIWPTAFHHAIITYNVFKKALDIFFINEKESTFNTTGLRKKNGETF